MDKKIIFFGLVWKFTYKAFLEASDKIWFGLETYLESTLESFRQHDSRKAGAVGLRHSESSMIQNLSARCLLSCFYDVGCLSGKVADQIFG